MQKCKLIFFLAFNCLFFYTNAQVAGISASKLSTINAATVPHNKIEFEPSLGLAYTSQYFDQDGAIQELFMNKDSVINETEFGFRITYGIFNKLEMGIYLPTTTEALSLGAKFLFMEKNRISLSGMAGFNTPLNQNMKKGERSYIESSLAAIGIVGTYLFSDNFSMDADGQIQVSMRKSIDDHKLDYFLDLDIGCYVFSWLQPVVGFNYGSSVFSNTDINSSELLMNTGFTIEPAQNFLLVINSPFSLAGKNINKTIGFEMALTITLE